MHCQAAVFAPIICAPMAGRKGVRSKGEDRQMVPPVEFRFEIKAYSPETMPLDRLAQYLDSIATLLGEARSVHLRRIDGGSTVPVLAVDWESVPKVKKRANDVRNDEGPEEAKRAKRTIERYLAEDNADYGDLVDHHGARVLRFPGRQKQVDQEFGPFSQPGTLDGVPIVVGGENDPVPVHLQDRAAIHNCLAARDIAKQIGHYLFSTPLRVSGVGRWVRTSHGLWVMKRFTIQSFSELRGESLHDVTARLQAINARWKKTADPLSDLAAIRGDEELH